MIGSFIACAVWRIRMKLSFLWTRSCCPECKKQLAWYDNIPLVSFLWLKGRCRYCRKNISWQYFWIELASALLFLLAAHLHQIHHGVTPEFVRDSIILFLLLFTFVYDLLYQEILDEVTLYPAVILFVLSLVFDWKSVESLLFGMLAGAGFFLLQYVLSKGRWIGGGDIRLGAFMGVILGWPLILVALLLAYVGGAIISLGLIAFNKKKMKSQVPFGTFLTIATVAAIFWGDSLVSWYIKFL